MVRLSLFLALCAAAHAAVISIPGSLEDGAACATSELNGANAKCVGGLSCVINSFGMPALSIENGGVCRAVPRGMPQCSVDVCSARGYQALCTLRKADCSKWAGTAGCAVQCGAWAARRDGGRKPVCPVCKPAACEGAGPMASDGKRMCTLCGLKAASCKSGFKVMGPVAAIAAAGAAGPAPTEARTAGAAVAPARPCSASGKAGMCAAGEFCLVTKFMPDDSTGTCKAEGNLVMCGVDFCTKNGAQAWCSTPFSGIATTCVAWATRKDYGRQADCRMSCPRNCDAPSQQVKDNKGTRYCSACALRAAACETNFTLHGAIPTKTSPKGYICSTKNPAFGTIGCKAGLTCVLTFFGYPIGNIGNVGTCESVGASGVCGKAFCQGKAPKTVCTTSDTKDVCTCQSWAVRSDGGV